MSKTIDDFAVSVHRVDEVSVVLTAVGELDSYTAPQLRQAIQDVLSAGSRQIVIDLAGVGFLDSTGLSVLVRAQRESIAVDGELRLRGPSPQVTRILEISGASRLFRFD